MRVSNSLDPDQDNILWVLLWVQTVCQGFQQTTLVGIRQSTSSIFNDIYIYSVSQFHVNSPVKAYLQVFLHKLFNKLMGEAVLLSVHNICFD